MGDANTLYTYIDSKYVVVKDTLLQIRDEEELAVPDTIADGKSITKIATYACTSSRCRSVKIAPGIKAIGDHAFRFSTLKEVTLATTDISLGYYAFGVASVTKINIHLSEDEYTTLLTFAKGVGNNHFIIPATAFSPSFKDNLHSGLGYKFASGIDSFDRIYMMDSLEEDNVPDLFKPIPCYDFLHDIKMRKSEDEGVIDLIAKKQIKPVDIEDENLDDARIKSGKKPTQSQSVLFEYIAPSQITQDGVNITFMISNHIFFGQRIRRIMYKGKAYYLYQRVFINNSHRSNSGCDNMAIYSEDGLVTDYELSEAVYEKYLFSVLL